MLWYFKCSTRAGWQQQWVTDLCKSCVTSHSLRSLEQTQLRHLKRGWMKVTAEKRRIATVVFIPWNSRSSSCIYQDYSSFFLSFFKHSALHLYQMLHFNFNLLFALQKVVKPTVALCQQKCKRSGTLESNYCSSNFGKGAKFLFNNSFSTVFLDSRKFYQM